MHHFVYETKNLINGKKYIGKHITNDLNDGYLGSGKILKQAIKKYGKGNFERIILSEFDNEEDAFECEKRLVTEEIMKDVNYYNIAIGGSGGYNLGTKKLWENEDFRKMRTEQVKEQWKDKEWKKMLSDKAKKEWKDPKYKKQRSDSIKKKWENPEYRKIKSETNRGENSARAKLTEINVIDIKKRLQTKEKHKNIAKLYNVSIACIRNIRYGYTWKHVVI
jgi:hypothetical protein